VQNHNTAWICGAWFRIRCKALAFIKRVMSVQVTLKAGHALNDWTSASKGERVFIRSVVRERVSHSEQSREPAEADDMLALAVRVCSLHVGLILGLWKWISPLALKWGAIPEIHEDKKLNSLAWVHERTKATASCRRSFAIEGEN
jgi:hypothetical protein